MSFVTGISHQILLPTKKSSSSLHQFSSETILGIHQLSSAFCTTVWVVSGSLTPRTNLPGRTLYYLLCLLYSFSAFISELQSETFSTFLDKPTSQSPENLSKSPKRAARGRITETSRNIYRYSTSQFEVKRITRRTEDLKANEEKLKTIEKLTKWKFGVWPKHFY